MNASDHEQFGLRTNFLNTKRLGWHTVSRVTNTQAVPRDREKKKNPFQTITFHFLTTFHLLRQLSSSLPSTYTVTSPPYRYGKTKLSFRLYLICLVLCISFFFVRFNGFHWFCVKNLCTKYCCKSLNKQSSGVQERINPFHINSYGENIFGLRTTFRNELSSWTEVWLYVNRFYNFCLEHCSF